MTTPTLRPLSTGELLDRTFALYRSHFLLFVGITALANLVALAFQLAFLALGGGAASALGCAGMAVFLPLMLVVTLGVTAATQGATIVAVSHVYLGRPITAVGALSLIRGRIVPLAMTMIVLGIATTLGFLLLIVPGLILSLMWALAIPVAVLESRDMMDAASRSAELTSGSRFRVFVVYAMFLVVLFVVSIVVQMPIGMIAAETTPAFAVLSAVGSFIASCLVGPLMTIGLSLLYYDQRVRKEAFDLELMMAAIDGEPVANGI